MLCIHFSCKKDGTSTQTSPNIDSLPIPFKEGTWWRYQRIDSVNYPPYAGSFYTPVYSIDTSIELISVIGKAQYVDSAIVKSPVESIILEVKNLTKGTSDTIHAFYLNPNYNNAYFIIRSNKDSFNLFIKMPLVEGSSRLLKPGTGFDYDDFTFHKNSSVTILNKIFDGCSYTEDFQYYYGIHKSNDYYVTTFLKPSVGLVYWEVLDILYADHAAPNTKIHYRRLIDYHIEP